MEQLYCLSVLTWMFSIYVLRTPFYSTPSLRCPAVLALLGLTCWATSIGNPLRAHGSGFADKFPDLEACSLFWTPEDLGVKHCIVPGMFDEQQSKDGNHTRTAQQFTSKTELIVRAHFFLKGTVFNGATHVCPSTRYKIFLD
jgi:hypothetical protein